MSLESVSSEFEKLEMEEKKYIGVCSQKEKPLYPARHLCLRLAGLG